MQTNDELKIIIEDLSQDAFHNDWDRTTIKNKIEQKIFTDEDREWALGKVLFKHQHLKDVKSHKKSGRSKIALGIICVIVGIVMPFIYNFIIINKRSVAVTTIPIVIGLSLIWNGRNDLARY